MLPPQRNRSQVDHGLTAWIQMTLGAPGARWPARDSIVPTSRSWYTARRITCISRRFRSNAPKEVRHMLPVDADSHFFEPLDLFERYIDSRFRKRAYRVQKDPATGKLQLVVDQKPLQVLD